jgi:hypothetical protein
MSRPRPVPAELSTAPFTLDQAARLGVTRRMLQSSAYAMVHRGVYVSAGRTSRSARTSTPIVFGSPADASVSHLTALHWYGVEVGSTPVRHYSTNTTSQTRLDGVELHRRRGRLSPRTVGGVPVLGPDRTLVDCAPHLSPRDLVRAGDWLVRLGLTTPEVLQAYARERHLDGVVLTRRTSLLVRSRVDSVKETDVRLVLVASRLPEPEVNGTILDDRGEFVAQCDLVYRELRIVIEYDGWHHERSADQRQRDILRRERLEAAGWRVIVVTAADLRNLAGLVGRVWDAMTSAGYRGPAPRFDPVRLRTLRDM